MNIDVCTLFEGDYEKGVAALINSLVRFGYKGTIWAGYRGELPSWSREARQTGDKRVTFAVGDRCQVHLVRVEAEKHLTLYKSRFILDLLDSDETTGGVAYFDPDITIRTQWDAFEKWIATDRVALCEDLFPYLPEDHPIRLEWIEKMAFAGRTLERKSNRYYNSGFVGVGREQKNMIGVWADLLDKAVEKNLITGFKQGDRGEAFYDSDQDMLNYTVMVTRTALSTVGPEGMSFSPGRIYYMRHAVTPPKPWRITRKECSAVSQAHNAFWWNTKGPISIKGLPGDKMSFGGLRRAFRRRR